MQKKRLPLKDRFRRKQNKMSGGPAQATPPLSAASGLVAPKYLWSTSDGRCFEGPTALASYIGVSTGAVCNAAKEAQQRESDAFSCGGQSCFRRQLMTEAAHDLDAGSNVAGAVGCQYLLSLMPVMQAHAHLQAAALRLYPGRRLKIPTLSVHQIQSIRAWIPRSEGAISPLKFDLAQLWSLHSPSSYSTQYGFRRALLGEPQEKPVAELRKYPSLSFFTHEQLSKPSVALDADDIIKFMLSDFARKGQFDEIFELPPSEELPPAVNGPVNVLQNKLCTDATDIKQESNAPIMQAPRTPPPSPRRAFSQASLQRMREIEHNISAGVEVEQACEGVAANATRAKRRRLALTAACGITRVLFDANKLLLDAMLKE